MYLFTFGHVSDLLIRFPRRKFPGHASSTVIDTLIINMASLDAVSANRSRARPLRYIHYPSNNKRRLSPQENEYPPAKRTSHNHRAQLIQYYRALLASMASKSLID